MLAIKNNLMAENAARHLGRAYDSLAVSVERLSSGLRINSAKDDAAGLAVRELIRADIAVLRQGARNALDGISMFQTMEGAMAVMDENLIRMTELAAQAATGSYSDAQRTIMNAEFAEMASEIERIAANASFNDIMLLNSTTGSVSIHVGTTDTIDITAVDMTKSGLNIETGSGEWSATSEVDNGVASASTGSWLNTAGAASFTLDFGDFGFTGGEIAFTMAAGTHTLQDVVDAINLASNNPATMYNGSGELMAYSAAEVVQLRDGTYGLKVTARESTATAMSFLAGGAIAGITGGLGLGAFADNADLMVAAESVFEFWNTSTSTWDTDNAGRAGSGLNILTTGAAVSALATIDSAISAKDTARASFGYKMNRLESTVAILDVQAENLLSAESRISDVDVATEMAMLTRTQVLAQAGVAMLAQANTMPQMALTLLR
jgi:flagellin